MIKNSRVFWHAKNWRPIFIILILVLLSNLILAAEPIAQRVKPEEEVPALLVLWRLIRIPLAIVLGVLVLAYIIVRVILMVLKWIKYKDNEVQKLVETKIKLARAQSHSGYITKFLGWKKSTRVYLFYKEKDTGKLTKEPFSVYMGHFIDNEGILWLAFANQPLHFLLWFIPKIEIMMIPTKNEIRITKVKDIIKQEFTTKKIKTQPIQCHFMDGEVLIETTSIDQVSAEFDLYMPVIKDEKGKIIDPTRAQFQMTENLVLKKVQYDILNSYAHNIRKGMEMNVIMKGKQKLGDTEGSVE